MTRSHRPRILFVDAYDSFSNNIISLLETNLNVEVAVIKIDAQIERLSAYLNNYVAVIAGPGPGDPRTPKDVGLFQRLWELEGADMIPVLGVCLGFQSLVLAHGGKIECLPEPRHGLVRRVTTNEESIFRGIPSLQTVQYHSLHAVLPFPGCAENRNKKEERLVVAQSGFELAPLAWDYEVEKRTTLQEQASKRNPDRILMAVRHKKKPLYGMQFHPESISSSFEAQQVIRNWWDDVCIWRAELSKKLNTTWHGLTENSCNGHNETCRLPKANNSRVPHRLEPQTKVISKIIDLASLNVPKICEAVGAKSGNAVVFDSENHLRAETGAFSIIGVIENDSMRIEYSKGSSEVRQISNGKISTVDLGRYDGSIFNFLEAFMQSRTARHNQDDLPFWGGLMGYITYEACLETLGIHRSVRSDPPQSRPDIGFIFIERSIVIDHFHQSIHVQSIKPNDHSWVMDTSLLLSSSPPTADQASLPQHLDSTITLPDESQYKSKIGACQASIRAGNSYELCLTSQTKVTTPSRLPPWPMYCRLRDSNPAPFGAYIRFGDLTVLSSSPERFMRWTRPSVISSTLIDDSQSPRAGTSILQFRPIKGTIARRPTPNSRPWSFVEATKLLSTKKERAENLMIADLIRHDLHGVVGSGRVTVPKLMVVEEYETVFQLVTVIEGTMLVEPPREILPEERKEDNASDCDQLHVKNGLSNRSVSNGSAGNGLPHPRHDNFYTETGPAYTPRVKASSPLSALPATLPPGSMTGAPKLRSCQILQSFEADPRGVYSGIIGYIDVGGGGDWSVAIRCAVRWDDPGNTMGDDWTIGAGGAVTALSTVEGEWEEMLAKLQATLRIFQD